MNTDEHRCADRVIEARECSSVFICVHLWPPELQAGDD
jgi:hypothetical protein